MYSSDGGFNYSGYAADEVDRLIEKGNEAETLDDSVGYYQRAEDAVLADLPVVPLWFERLHIARSAHVTSVPVDAFGVLRLDRVRLGRATSAG